MMLYLLHATSPLGTTGRNSASHYLGWTEPNRLAERLKLHRNGRGAAITRAFIRVGGKLLLALTIAGGTRSMERRLKTNGHLWRMCPLCNVHLAVLGRPVSPAQLRLAMKYSRAPTTVRWKARGGGLSPGNLTGKSTWSQAGPPPAPATASHADTAPAGMTPSGGALSATAPPKPAGSISPAGTKLRSS